MDKLDSFIFAMFGAASDLHYVALLENDWATHLKADRLRDGLIGWRDDIQEVHKVVIDEEFIGAQDSFKSSAELIKPKPKTVKDAENNVRQLIEDTLVYIKELENEDLPVGTLNLIQGFAQDLQRKRAFLVKKD